MLRACFVLVALVPAAVAVGQDRPIDQARDAYREGELYRALELFGEALETPGNSPADLVTIHVHLGILKGSLADIPGARAAFETALAVDATLTAPSELNPALREVFEAVASERGGQAVAIEVEPREPIDPDGDLEVGIRVTGAPDALIATVRAEAMAEGGEPVTAVAEPSGDGRSRITIPEAAWHGGRRLQIRTSALDAYGGVVASTTTDVLAPGASTITLADEESEVEDDGGGGVLSSPWFWIVTAVLVLGAGAAITAVVLTTETRADVGPPIIMGLSL